MLDVSNKVKVTSINGNLMRGGWEVRFNSLSDTDVCVHNQRVVLNWQGAFGGAPGVARSGFIGYVIPQRFRFDRKGSIAEFIAQTTDGALRRGWLQGIGFRDTGVQARGNYHRFDSVTGAVERMTIGRIVRHLLGYYDVLGAPPATNPDWVSHTNLVYHATQNPGGWITLTNVTTTPFADPANLAGTMRTDRYIVRESKNLWNTIRKIAESEFFVAYFTKYDDFYYQRHPMFGTLPAPVMTFDESFAIGQPTVEQLYRGQVEQVRLLAVTDDGDTLHAEYPSSPTHVYGNVDVQSYLRCNDQDTLDEWCRIKYLWLNREHTVRWTAPGICGLLFEILDRVSITYSGTSANGVHINWVDKKFWIHDITVRPDAAFGGTTVFTLEEENV